MLDLVKYLVSELVENKDAISIIEKDSVIRVTVDKKDMGKIIGRQGKIAKAIRTIVRAAGMKNGSKYTVDIVDGEGGEVADIASDSANDDAVTDEMPDENESLDTEE